MDKSKTNKIALAIRVLLAVFVAMLIDWQFGGLRFSRPRWNYWAITMALLLPLICVVLLGFLPRSRSRLWSALLLIPLALFDPVLWLPWQTAWDVNSAFNRVFSVPLGNSQIVEYYRVSIYSDYDDWADSEIFVQQEQWLLPGLLLIKPLSDLDLTPYAEENVSVEDVNLKVLDRHHVLCSYPILGKKKGCDYCLVGTKDEIAWAF